MSEPQQDRPFPPVTRREIFGWCCYDFSNSAFTTVIITVVYSIFFTKVVCGSRPGADTLWATGLAISQAIVILLSPWLGAVADATASKKRFLMSVAAGCIFFTGLLYFTGPGTVALAMALVVVANTCFSLGENFCASFLPELSTPATAGRISGYGWSFGYVGGLLSLGICYWIAGADAATGGDVRPVFPATALFMLAGTSATALLLTERATPAKSPRSSSFRAAWSQLRATWAQISRFRTLFTFLFAFLLFMSGLAGVVVFAAIFAERELSFSVTELVLLFAGLQISSSLGAFIFGFIQDRFGSIRTLSIGLLLWVAVGVLTYFCHDKTQFLVIGNLAGLAIGSTQSASRAIVSNLAPPGMAGEIFGFWGVFGKLAAIVGPLTMGVISDLINLRTAVLSTTIFFLAGLFVLRRVPIDKDGHAAKS